MPSNSDPAAGQNGQQWHPGSYAKNGGFVAQLGLPVVALLDPRDGEDILDLGCGDGVLTETLSAAGANVVGVDASSELVGAALAKGVDARRGNGENLEFDHEFDAVFSNAALHWMLDPDAVVAGVARALRPGGRFVGEFGGFGNCEIIIAALHDELARLGHDAGAADPWYFPTPAEYQTVLETAGFSVSTTVLIDRPTPLPGSLADWLDTFAGSFLSLADPGQRGQLVEDVCVRAAGKLCDKDGIWTLDYVRLRFAAYLPRG